jgi:hypothetical protein
MEKPMSASTQRSLGIVGGIPWKARMAWGSPPEISMNDRPVSQRRRKYRRPRTSSWTHHCQRMGSLAFSIL